jgi:hypothetical protein
MTPTIRRILKNGTIVVVLLSIFGFFFAQILNQWVSSQAVVRSNVETSIGEPVATVDQQPLQSQIQWRVPLTMAGLGLGVVVAFELLGSIWRPSKPLEIKPKTHVLTDDEIMMQILLKEAEKNPSQTPAPAMQLKTINEPAY